MASNGRGEGDEAHQSLPSSLVSHIRTTEQEQSFRGTHSRSPHPYLRRRRDPQQQQQQRLGSETGSSEVNSIWNWARRPSSESGTEADDEGPGVLKGLPAPPSNTWRISRYDGGGDEETDHKIMRKPSLRGNRKYLSSTWDKEDVDARSAKRKRRKLDVLRRVCETVLMLSVGVIVFLPGDVRVFAGYWKRGMCGNGDIEIVCVKANDLLWDTCRALHFRGSDRGAILSSSTPIVLL